jgi:predicted signal transduction protein with EAL and GGDEF domain
MRHDPPHHNPPGSDGPVIADQATDADVISLGTVREGYRDVIADLDRLDALYRLDLMDAEPQQAFADITELLRLSFGVKVARIHVLDDVSQWVLTASGDPDCTTLGTEVSVCQYTIRQYQTMVVPDLLADREFIGKPIMVDGEPMRFYAGAPLTTEDGQNVGVVCLMDPEPHEAFDAASQVLLEKMAALTIHAVEMRQAHSDARRDLLRALDQDPVTGLFSRRGLLLRLQRLVEGATAERGAVALLELRVERIERVEQAYGTSVVNGLMRDIGERLSRAAHSGELIGRPDNAGFLVIGRIDDTDAAGIDAAIEARADALIEALAAPLIIGDSQFQPAISCGVARAPADGQYAYELFNITHDASLRAARQPTARLAWPDRAGIAAQRQQLSFEARLRRAVSRDEFSLVYQPIIDLRDGERVAGAEVLLRWPQPDSAPPIGPDAFIPLAEELGLMDRLGKRVFERACQQLARWQTTPQQDAFWLSINLAPSQLQDPDLAKRFLAMSRAAGIAPSRIKLEITESAFEADFDTAATVADALAAAGFALALDDFGTGHASMSRLINLPFSVLKVDRSFVSAAPDGAGAAVVTSLGQLAANLDLEAIGEGVQTPAHEAFLRHLGYYAYAQGYHYARPMSATAFEAWQAAR